MKLHSFLLVSCLAVAAMPSLGLQTAQACTPAPDQPNGCDGINGGKIRIPPRPVCLTCPPEIRRTHSLILPTERLKRPNNYPDAVKLDRLRSQQQPIHGGAFQPLPTHHQQFPGQY